MSLASSANIFAEVVHLCTMSLPILSLTKLHLFHHSMRTPLSLWSSSSAFLSGSSPFNCSLSLVLPHKICFQRSLVGGTLSKSFLRSRYMQSSHPSLPWIIFTALHSLNLKHQNFFLSPKSCSIINFLPRAKPFTQLWFYTS